MRSSLRSVCIGMVLSACSSPSGGDDTGNASSGGSTSEDPGTTSEPTTPTTGATSDPTTTNITTTDTTGPAGDTTIVCGDPPDGLPAGMVGVGYGATVLVTGGAAPFEWQATGLPPGLELQVQGGDPTATIVGTPTQAGAFDVTFEVTDAGGITTSQQCEVIVSGSAKLDLDALLGNFPEGCVPLDVPLTKLIDLGILGMASDEPWTCALEAGIGNGSSDFDGNPGTPDTFPPGIMLEADTCTMTGALAPSLPFGVYAWIATFEQAGARVLVPYCAAQMIQTPAAYTIERFDGPLAATFSPGLGQLSPEQPFAYGTDAPGTEVLVMDFPCEEDCYYGYIYTYSTLGQDAIVSAAPNSFFPNDKKPVGLTHAIRVEDPSATVHALFNGRPWVVNVLFEYCVADNDTDCGNNAQSNAELVELVRGNGDGSVYMFSLLVLPK